MKIKPFVSAPFPLPMTGTYYSDNDEFEYIDLFKCKRLAVFTDERKREPFFGNLFQMLGLVVVSDVTEIDFLKTEAGNFAVLCRSMRVGCDQYALHVYHMDGEDAEKNKRVRENFCNSYIDFYVRAKQQVSSVSEGTGPVYHPEFDNFQKEFDLKPKEV